MASVNRSRANSLVAVRRFPSATPPLRLDLVGNPYGPSIHVHDALTGGDDLHLPAEDRQTRLHIRLATMLGVGPDWLTLANGVDELLGMILLWRRGRGPLLLFPPSDPWEERRAGLHGFELRRYPRSPRWALDLDPERSFPSGGTALVGSPNDPTGTLLGNQDLVRLARGCELVVVDERHTEYSARSVIPLAREFDNVVVVQTMETWAGLSGLPVAYAVAPPAVSAALARYSRPTGLAAASVIAAHATLDDLAYVRATVQRVREEKSRLYRTLRKLNTVRPHDSWANFLLARVERGDADQIARELACRGIQVHRPQHPELAHHLRISAVSPEGTTALKHALIEIGAGL